MAKLKIGDVVEISTSKGFAYAQYTHKHKQYGALLRVFGSIYNNRLADIKDLVNEKPIFSCFFPLSAAVDQQIVSIVGNEEVPVDTQNFPIFRAGIINQATKKVDVWWLWDGEKEWKIGDLDSEQRKLPIRGIWNDTLLIERIESNWTPETDPS